MPSIPTRSPWDFSDALKLLRDTADQDEVPILHDDATTIKLDGSRKRAAGLGDFDRIWKVLGTTPDTTDDESQVSDFGVGQLHTNSTAVQDFAVPNPNRPPAAPLRDETYASDGVYHSTRKNVTWKDEPEFLGGATDAPTTPTSEEGPLATHITLFSGDDATDHSRDATTNKKQAKKEKKKRQRLKKLFADQEQQTARTRNVVSDIESESEIRPLAKPTPAFRASKHTIPPPKHALLGSGNANQSVQPEPKEDSTASGTAPESSDNVQGAKRKRARSRKTGNSEPYLPMPMKIETHIHDLAAGNLVTTAIPQQARSTPTQDLSQLLQSQFATNIPAHTTVVTTPRKHPTQQVYPFISPQRPVELDREFMFDKFVPSPFEDTEQQRCLPINFYINVPTYSRVTSTGLHSPFLGAAQHAVSYPLNEQPLTAVVSQQFQILEKEERDLQLLLRLIHKFSEDKKWLTKPVPMADHNSSPNGIHVFVDFSNIWIGFMDHLKHLQVKMHQRIPHQNISFDALVLLLERKRPVAKRVLAGSYPLMPAMELARQIGYETLILEKVYKSREPTERQRRMLAMQSRTSFAALGTQGLPQAPSSTATGVVAVSIPPTKSIPPTSTPALAPAPEKWVEQGVDEILHLKILESIVDSDIPSRMVVATGDAAKAEYSEGFMKMIVRALKKGWYVELVAFSKSISSEYSKPGFLSEWGERFRILELDGWAQYLLDT